VADVALRYARVTLQAPDYPGQKGKAPVEVSIIHIVEKNAPPGVKRLEWFLLTTIDIPNVETALQCVRWYCLRWRIEDWHRVLKSGCRIEDVGHKTAERIQRAIAINLVIAWRIMLMALLGREAPELPAEVLFSDIEIEVLRRYAKKNGMKPPTTVGIAVRLVARLGGYLDRTRDPPPGHELMWRGYATLMLLCQGFSLKDA
jgi:hypothetical protein